MLQEVEIKKPRISNIRVRLEMNEKGVETRTMTTGGQVLENDYELSLVPDVLGAIQSKTKLTKSTIIEVLKKADKLKDILLNPQLLIDEAANAINSALKKMMIDGIKYEKIDSSFYEMRQLENQELEEYLDKIVMVNNLEKTLYDHVIFDSSVESQFAMDLDAREDVKFYFKLPRWFKIPTPIGDYIPDWAIVFENDKRIYFVVETKADGEIRESEDMKIKCGREHFRVLDGCVIASGEVGEYDNWRVMVMVIVH